MAKQIKLGFDRIPTPATATFEQLYDIGTGQPLVDEKGNPIYTNVPSSVKSYGSIASSTSLHINNPNDDPVPILEQYPDTSQVSSSLLGVPRAEVQLSLFSDVSTYGLDTNIWEFYSLGWPGQQPPEWTARRSKIYGPRYYCRLEEVANEQALAITAYPVPYTYPYGPKFQDIGSYNKPLFERYLRFIDLGTYLYNKYAGRNRTDFAKKHFLNPIYAQRNGDDVDYYTNNYSIDDIFEEIEKWTITWMRMRNGELKDELDGSNITFPKTPETSFDYDASNTIPGYSSAYGGFGQMESKRVFRYQPGRISGFTYGIRASADQGSKSNIIEWGCGNNTDEYLFQLKGSTFSIVRRSTIPLPPTNLAMMGLKESDQQFVSVYDPLQSAAQLAETGNYSGDSKLFELVIPRDKFNGDPLNGNGPSGYLVSFEQVTMWKIEFSWYGAIGAKFYIYTPASNGEARWILIHTIIIENSLGSPCLESPFFKFKYKMYQPDTSNLRDPQYIYKYGASYYIDGGDEGTVTLHNYSSNEVTLSTEETKSVVGISPKNYILNSTGDPVENKKDIIPQKMTVTSNVAAKVDVIECEACPGFGHHYAPSLVNGSKGVTGAFTVSADGQYLVEKIIGVPASWKPAEGYYKKIIADGIYSSYIDSRGKIVRRIGGSSRNNFISTNADYSSPGSGNAVLSDGTLVRIPGRDFNVRLTGYDDIIASPTPLTKNNIRINFLNPIRYDGKHSAEFFIGLSNREPRLVNLDGENQGLRFGVNNDTFDIERTIYGEWAHYATVKNVNGYDVSEGEWRYGYPLEIDPRIPTPGGVDTGRCSQIRVTIEDFSYPAYYSRTIPGQPEGDYLLFYDLSISAVEGLAGGEIGIPDGFSYTGSNVYFVNSNMISFVDPVSLENRYALRITADISVNIASVFAGVSKISIKTVSLDSRYISRGKVFNYNIFPLYLVIGMRDNAAINNITVEEFDESGKFSYTPQWLVESNCNINIVNSGKPISSYKISTVTKGLLTTITTASAHGLYVGGTVRISGATGIAEINGKWKVKSINSATSFSIGIDTTTISNNYNANSGTVFPPSESFNAQTGLFESAGLSFQGTPSTNFVDNFRLDGGQVDTQLQQPLRPGEVRSSFYVGANDTEEFELTHIYGADRYTISPGALNAKATFITGKALVAPESGATASIQINLLTKEQ